MEASKLLIASIAISLVFVGVWADAGAEEEAVIVEPDVSDSVLKLELEQLRSKISALEKIIEEKAASILSLQSEIESVQLQKTNDEQRHRIHKTERALKVAEEELMRAQLEATAKSMELSQRSAKIGRRRSIKGEIDHRWSIKGEIDRRRSIEEEKGKRKKKKKRKKRNKKRRRNTSPARPRCPWVARTPSSLAGNFSPRAGRWNVSRSRREIEATSPFRLPTRGERLRRLESHSLWFPFRLTELGYHLGLLLISFIISCMTERFMSKKLSQATEKLAQAQKWVEPQLETAKTVNPYFQVLTD
ncbi:hypothetical protein GW17_00026675 [Ensete ventricosum]|nr:hypothetical protein GW17_00026675 [Ensete ventricosum]